MMRSITDFGMGFIYVGVGIIILFAKQFNFSNDFTIVLLQNFCSIGNYLRCVENLQGN